MKNLASFLILILIASFNNACDQTAIPPNAELGGASLLQFRCVNLSSETIEVAPLAQCGCLTSELSDEGQRSLNQVAAEECQNENVFELVGYLGSPTLSKVAIMHLGNGPRAILDQSTSIPGISHYHSDNLINELLVHPYGDFMFTVNYHDGSLSLSRDHRELRPDLHIDLGIGPLADAELWPSLHQDLPADGSPSLLYVSSVLDHSVYELDLDLIALELDQVLSGEEIDPTNFMRRSWTITNNDGEARSPRRLSINEAGNQLAVSMVGEMSLQVLSLADFSAESESNSEAELPLAVRHLPIQARLFCNDSYRSQVLSFSRAYLSCEDGFDNDEDGLVDHDDSDCIVYGAEAQDLSCVQLDYCHDQIDNDDDGLIDMDDPECSIENNGLRKHYESPAPACDDGLDNDEDGLVDRADDGCSHQDDPSEVNQRERSSCFDGLDNDGDGDFDTADSDCQVDETADATGQFNGEGDDLCRDELDNDGDGLIDADDPGCHQNQASELYGFERQAECSDGIDNDGDGLVDFAQDLDCAFAADRNELGKQVSTEPSTLKLITVNTKQGPRDLVISHDQDGALVIFELDQDGQFIMKTLSDIRFPHSIEVRSTGQLLSAWVIDQSNTLNAVHLTMPSPLLTANQEPIYAHGTIQNTATSVEMDANSNQSPSVLQNIEVEAFYIVREGYAYRLTALDQFTGTLSYDSYTNVPLIPQAAQATLLAMDQDSFAQLETLDLPEGAGGLNDPQVFVSDQFQLHQNRWNRNRTALGQVNRVAESAVFSMNGIQITANKSRHVGFCATTREENLQDDNPACILVGSDVEGQVENLQDQFRRRKNQLEFYEGVQVYQSDYQQMISGNVSVSYEATIPNSRSRTGQHLRLVQTPDDQSQEWHFADYRADFCELGVEAGDLLVAERFYPSNEAAAKDPECRAYLVRSPSEGEDPLRFRVKSVSQKGLTLIQDQRQSYAPQLDLLGSSRLPKLAPSLPPPPYRCAAQAIAYSLRVGQDHWLVNTQALGFIHPWENQEGQCVKSKLKEAKKWYGRAKLGQIFENPWFRFKLGYQSAQVGASGIPNEQLPTMVGSALSFNLSRGALYQLILGVGLLPVELRWLPELDRLYIVDAALKSVTEYDNVNPYLGNLSVVQSFQ